MKELLHLFYFSNSEPISLSKKSKNKGNKKKWDTRHSTCCYSLHLRSLQSLQPLQSLLTHITRTITKVEVTIILLHHLLARQEPQGPPVLLEEGEFKEQQVQPVRKEPLEVQELALLEPLDLRVFQELLDPLELLVTRVQLEAHLLDLQVPLELLD
jgi:hypothetical protein